MLTSCFDASNVYATRQSPTRNLKKPLHCPCRGSGPHSSKFSESHSIRSIISLRTGRSSAAKSRSPVFENSIRQRMISVSVVFLPDICERNTSALRAARGNEPLLEVIPQFEPVVGIVQDLAHRVSDERFEFYIGTAPCRNGTHATHYIISMHQPLRMILVYRKKQQILTSVFASRHPPGVHFHLLFFALAHRENHCSCDPLQSEHPYAT